MADVRAFRGIRYRSGGGSASDETVDLSSLLCAPYDVITPEAQAICYERDPHNAVRLELGQAEPRDDATSNRYSRAAAYLRAWLAEGAIAPDAEPAFYVYEERFADAREAGSILRRRGFFAAVRLAEWDAGVVLPHEKTLPKPKVDRLDLLRVCRTNLSPVFSLYDDPAGVITGLLDRACATSPVAIAQIAPDQIAAAAPEHRLWRLTDPAALAAIQRHLADRPLFIADGHHRYETALNYWHEAQAAGEPEDSPAGWVMMLLVEMGDPGLIVLPTHRLVAAEQLDATALDRLIDEWCDVAEISGGLATLEAALAARASSAHAFGLVGPEPGRLRLLTVWPSAHVAAALPAGHCAAWQGLDVAVLHTLLIDRLPAATVELTYSRDSTEVVKTIAAGESSVGFLLHPTRVSQIRDVALAGDRMPQKSTYFWPKPPTGLVFKAV